MGEFMKLRICYLNDDISKTQEVTFEGNSVSGAQLQAKISETFDVSADDFDVYYGLKCLECKPMQDIQDFGVKPGSKLCAIRKKLDLPTQETEPLDFSTVRNAAYGLHTMFQHSQQVRRRNKSAIIKLFEDTEAMDSIIASVDGLSEDQMAIDILENIKLFEVMVDPKNTKDIIAEHPSLARAFVTMWNTLMSSNRFSNFDPVSGSASGSQEVMDVDENQFLSVPAGGQSTASPNRIAANRNRVITQSQLADAIALANSPAEGAMFPYSAYNTPTPSNTQSPMPNPSRSATGTPSSAGTQQQRENAITPDVFSHAMQQALMSTGLQQVAESLQSDSASSGVASSISEDVMQTGLEQLRGMGITDDEASRQALAAAQGNVEAAVNLLFSGN